MILSEADLAPGTNRETDLGRPASPKDAHSEALTHIRSRLGDLAGTEQVIGFAHRIVHGGQDYAAPVEITDTVLSNLERLVPLAPSHQPHNLRPIRELRAQYPGIPQIGCFDTAFHRTQPHLAQMYALPREMTGSGILRYGFHGLSYDYIAHELKRAWPDLADKRIIVAHLGHGVSLCALHSGQSMATTMGLTALDGMPMGRRSGEVGPGVILHLILDLGYSPEEVRDVLYQRSGLLGVSGISSEMNDLLASDRPEAAEAVDLFVYRFQRSVGSLIAALGGIDGVVLTGGMGEHIPALRARLMRALRWLEVEIDETANRLGGPVLTKATSRLPVLMLPTDEELVLARSASEQLMEKQAAGAPK